jgi:hypothetical protein
MRMAPITNQIGTSACTNQLLKLDGVDDEESVGEETTRPPPEDDDPEDINFLCCTEEDILHGYLPDSTYNPVNMEEGGVYPQELNWSYSDIVPGTPDTTYPHYNGASPCLRKYVDWKFETLLGPCGIAGGFSYELVKQIPMNSNA